MRKLPHSATLFPYTQNDGTWKWHIFSVYMTQNDQLYWSVLTLFTVEICILPYFLLMSFMCAAATDHQHGWGATRSDQTQSRWEDLRQDEERPGAPGPTACKLNTHVIKIQNTETAGSVCGSVERTYGYLFMHIEINKQEKNDNIYWLKGCRQKLEFVSHTL